MSVASGCQNNGLVGVALVLGDLAVVPGSFFGLAFRLPIDSLCLSSRLLWLLWQDSRAMYPLFTDCTKKGPHWRRLREMHAFRAEVGRIFVPCIRFGVQSDDFGYIARESCQGGPFFASRSLESCMGRRSCQRSALRGPFRSGGQNKGPCCVRKGHAHAACPFPASAFLDTRRLKKVAILPFMENGRCDRGKCLARLRKSLR